MATERRPNQRRRPPDEPVTVRIALRLAYIHSIERDARVRLGRPPTADELRTELRRYPGD